MESGAVLRRRKPQARSGRQGGAHGRCVEAGQQFGRVLTVGAHLHAPERMANLQGGRGLGPAERDS